MVDHLVTFWLWVWSKPTRLWCYVTGRTPQSLARLVITFAHVGLVVRIALTSFGGVWAGIDALLVAYLTVLMFKWRRNFHEWERKTKHRDDGTIYQYAAVPSRMVRGTAVVCSVNVLFFPIALPSASLWMLWFSAVLVAAQHEGGDKTLKQTVKNLVARVKAIRLPKPSWKPAPAPRPIPV